MLGINPSKKSQEKKGLNNEFINGELEPIDVKSF